MKIPSPAQLTVLAAGLSLLFDLLTPSAWMASLAYLVPIGLASRVDDTKFELLIFAAAALLTLADWLWFNWPPPGDGTTAANTALVLLTLLFASRFFRTTDLKRNRKRSAQLGAILDHAEALIVLKDRQGRYVAVNSHLCSKWGVGPEHFIGQTDLEIALDPAFGQWLHDTDLALMEAAKTISREEQFPRLQDSTFYTTRFPVTDDQGTVIGLGGISMDITPLHEAHRVIESQRESLRRSNEDLERYAHMAAHDLQEPLRVIASLTKLLQNNLSKLDGESAEHLQLVVQNAERGRMQVRDLLEYAALNADWQPKAVDLNELVYEATKAVIAIAPALRVSANNLPEVQGNPKQLKLLFVHLISNGGKFNHNDQPSVTITATETDTTWRLHVTDDGFGIEPAYRKRAFEIFTRLQARSEFVGTGVGLAICRRVMELHGGTITVAASSQAGTTITCTLPKVHEAAGGIDYAARAAAS